MCQVRIILRKGLFPLRNMVGFPLVILDCTTLQAGTMYRYQVLRYSGVHCVHVPAMRLGRDGDVEARP
eukprot:COSAG02_NODE_290_length_25531_cov_75.132392_13_plen_68_part_00